LVEEIHHRIGKIDVYKSLIVSDSQLNELFRSFKSTVWLTVALAGLSVFLTVVITLISVRDMTHGASIVLYSLGTAGLITFVAFLIFHCARLKESKPVVATLKRRMSDRDKQYKTDEVFEAEVKEQRS